MFSGISSPALGEIDSGRIRCGMTNVCRFIASLGFSGDKMMKSVSDRHGNIFYDALGLTETSSLCEQDVYSDKHRIHGKMDLNAGVVVDYKSGKKMKSPFEIREALMMEGKREETDFQALFYLALAAERWSGKEMRFFYAMANDSDYLDEKFDIGGNVRSVTLCDSDADADRIDRFICDSFKDTNKSKCGKDPEKFMNVMNRVAEGPSSGWSSDPAVIDAVRTEFGYDRSKKNESTISKAIADYVKISESGIYYTNDAVLITKKKLDAALDRIDDLHAKMARESVTELPAAHDKNCSKCEYFQVCTKDSITVKTDGGDLHHQLQRVSDRNHRGPRRNGPGRCGPGHGEDGHDCREVRQPS